MSSAEWWENLPSAALLRLETPSRTWGLYQRRSSTVPVWSCSAYRVSSSEGPRDSDWIWTRERERESVSRLGLWCFNELSRRQTRTDNEPWPSVVSSSYHWGVPPRASRRPRELPRSKPPIWLTPVSRLWARGDGGEGREEERRSDRDGGVRDQASGCWYLRECLSSGKSHSFYSPTGPAGSAAEIADSPPEPSSLFFFPICS